MGSVFQNVAIYCKSFKNMVNHRAKIDIDQSYSQ